MSLFKFRAGRMRSRSVRPPTIGLLLLAMVLTLSFSGSALSAQATINLGNVESFGALSFTAMTNAGANTVVHGNIGSPTSMGIGVTHPGFAAYGPGTPELAAAQGQLGVSEEHGSHLHRDDPRADTDHADREHHRRRQGPGS
jgi:hypothetical protein